MYRANIGMQGLLTGQSEETLLSQVSQMKKYVTQRNNIKLKHNGSLKVNSRLV